MDSSSIVDLIEKKEITLGVIGLGYVGLPLAVAFANSKIRVIGFEKNDAKVSLVNKGITYIDDIEPDDIKCAVSEGFLKATNDFKLIHSCEAILICVPTPLDKFKKPNMTYIEKSCKEIGRNMKTGTFVCLESTTYPTTTEEFVLPILEGESGLEAEKDFWLAFSPERVDPGNEQYKTQNTPKILGAISKDGKQIGKKLYQSAIQTIHTVSSPKVAEMVKILENTYRLVNISMINELALLSNRMDIDIWEVIEAAKTKPYGFQAFFPGPGIGGHCIPLDPFYLEHIAKKYNFDLTMIHTAGQIDNLMPHRMMVKINFALNKKKKSINSSKILFLGAAYKANIGDERESPTLKIIDEVDRKKGVVSFHDPYIDEIKTENGLVLKSIELTSKTLNEADCVVLITKHDIFDLDFIKKHSKLIVDLRNAYAKEDGKIVKL